MTRWRGTGPVGNDASIRMTIIFALLNGGNTFRRDLKFSDLVSPDIRQPRLLPEKKACTWYPMVHDNGFYGNLLVFQQTDRCCGINRVKFQRIPKLSLGMLQG